MDNPNGISREKYWSELSLEEKVGRLRLEVKRYQYLVDHLRQVVSLLERHRHSGDGSEITVPLIDRQCTESLTHIHHSDEYF